MKKIYMMDEMFKINDPDIINIVKATPSIIRFKGDDFFNELLKSILDYMREKLGIENYLSLQYNPKEKEVLLIQFDLKVDKNKVKYLPIKFDEEKRDYYIETED
ncbi:hypothetical protein SNUCP2_21590 [Clostridium perfringens A]|uniref:hypothetical protein n=1 Tax=Clostridium perfringens TaxID=1502 RepID=UPI00399D52CD